jgi:CheY-like chemotaxis protein
LYEDARPTVLVIEDEPDNREILRLVVEQVVGARPVPAENGADGLAQLREALPDLVLLDLMMPGLDGYAVLAAIRADPTTRELPVLVITAMTRPQDRERALAAGANDFLDKPFDLDEVARRIRMALRLP